MWKKKEEFMENVNFELKFVHDNNVDIEKLAVSLLSLRQLSISFMGLEHGLKDVSMEMIGVQEGSSIFKLGLKLGASVLLFTQGANEVIKFLENINSYKNLQSQRAIDIKENKHYTVANSRLVDGLIDIIEEQNEDSSITITVNGNNNILNISSDELNKIRENTKLVRQVRDEKEEEKAKQEVFLNVLIAMRKATNTKKQVRDSAYCDKIFKDKAIATIFTNKEDKEQVLQDPFNNYFSVDIEVDRIDEEIKLYRVTKLHAIVPKD